MTPQEFGDADRLRLLLVEDNPGDVDLLREHLVAPGEDPPSLEVAGTLAEARARLAERDYTAVLLDLNLPDSTGLPTVERMVRYAPSTPVIVLTGSDVEELGTGALARGAADFIPKEEASGRLILRSVRYALERNRRHRAAVRYRALIENSRDLVVVLDRELSIRYLSPSIEPILGYEPAEKLGADASLDVHPDDRQAVEEEIGRVLADPGYVANLEYRVRHADGSWRVLATVAQNLLEQREIRGLVLNSRDLTELRRVERTAATSALRLQRILEALDDAVLTVDGETRTIVACNSAAERVFGRASDEMVGRSTRILYAEESGYRRAADQEGALRLRPAYRAEYWMQRQDGSRFMAELTTTLLEPAEGMGGGMVKVIRDISERLAQSRRVRFQAALLDQVGQPVIAVDQESNVTYWNSAVEKLTGWTREEVAGRTILDLVVFGADRETALEARAAAQAGRAWEGELRIERKDGGVALVRATVTPGPNPDGTPGGRIASGVDITELRRAEEESRRAWNRIRFQADLLEAVGQAVIVADLEGRVIYWNQAAEELYGWTRDEATGREITELTPAPEARDRAAEILEGLREGGSWTGEFDVQRKDGSTFRAFVTDSPVRDEEGGMIGVVGVSSDITELRALEDQLRQAQKMEAIGRLAGGVAHDFNNLLTVVKGHATLLLEALEEAPALQDEVEEILHAGHRASELTRRLLAFSRRQIMEARNVDLNQVTRDLEAMLSRLVPERIQFEVETVPDEVVVHADPSQLHQVLMNLVLNAVDAIPDSGRILLKVDAIELLPSEAEEMPSRLEAGPIAQLAVTDSGIGIEPELLDRIFEPFFTTKAEGRGTGLGLATTYGIVQQTGGHVRVRSAPGEGATFEVLLPRIDEPVEEVGRRPERPLRPGGGVVLLVEDEEAVRDVIRRILERAGYSVREAGNGREALAIVREAEPVDLVLSDVVMPDLGGVDLFKRLEADHPDLKVVLMSGYSELDVQAEIRDGGAAFLSKPFAPDDLLRCIADALDD